MPAIVVIGGQWGDEGKGRIVDLLARNASIIARYSAGNNAGHTVINSLGTFRLHLVPAGIFYPDKISLITNGVVIDPDVLLHEIETIKTQGVGVDRLFISDRAHILMPYHQVIDKSDEEARGGAAIGTTGRGVGPAFVDKVGRLGIRMAELIDPPAFKERLGLILPYKNAVLEKLYGRAPLSFDEVYDRYVEYGCKLAPFVRDTARMVHEALARNETVLLEGAQGSLLDLDAGTYEYVTSSVPSSSAAGSGIGVGIGPTSITKVYAVYKAYMTRVGNGPMPTELTDSMGETLREQGQEYGTTTGRPRRCGWFDAVASRYSAKINSVTGGVLTRLDVLDTLDSLSICTGYELDGEVVTTMPATNAKLERVKPIYEVMPGWKTPTTEARHFSDLPKAAQAYVKRIEQLLEVPIVLVSVGPERDQAIHVSDTI